jgi:hypothetical protein
MHLFNGMKIRLFHIWLKFYINVFLLHNIKLFIITFFLSAEKNTVAQHLTWASEPNLNPIITLTCQMISSSSLLHVPIIQSFQCCRVCFVASNYIFITGFWEKMMSKHRLFPWHCTVRVCPILSIYPMLRSDFAKCFVVGFQAFYILLINKHLIKVNAIPWNVKICNDVLG